MNENTLEEYDDRVYEIDPYFYEHYKKKVDQNGCEYIYLELIPFYWISFNRRNWWTKPRRQITYFWEQKTRDIRKKLGCKFIRINTSDAGRSYDTDYEVSKIQIFSVKLKTKK